MIALTFNVETLKMSYLLLQVDCAAFKSPPKVSLLLMWLRDILLPTILLYYGLEFKSICVVVVYLTSMDISKSLNVNCFFFFELFALYIMATVG